jgi:hypothetical protein
LALSVLSSVGCKPAPSGEGGESTGESGSTDVGEQGPITYHEHIRPLVETHCLNCHSEGGIGPVSLTSWAEVEPWAELLVASVESSVMPPWLPDNSCRSMRDSYALTSEQQQLFTRWRDDGLLAGDEADYVAPTPESDPDLGEPDLHIAIPEPYAPNQDINDDYRCIPITEPFSEDVFVTAIDVSPDRKELVHHVIVYLAGQNALDELDMLDAAEPGPGYSCYGGPGISIPDIVSMWAPGKNGPLRAPEGMAVRIPAGSRMILQMHYNTINATEPGVTDASAVDLWTLPAGEVPDEVINFVLFSNKGFEIPAGAAEHVVETEMGVPATGKLVGIAPHMHSLGVSMSADLPSHADACVVDIPRWDFNWQGLYYFEDSEWVDLQYGDVMRTRCQYDNSAGDQPVSYGDSTSDEMCVFYAMMSMPWTPGAAGLCGPAAQCIDSCAPDDIGCFLTCIKTSGTACFACALQKISACAPQFCVEPIVPLLECVTGDQCPTEADTCLPLQCEQEFEAAWDCLAPHVFAGECDADLSECGLALGG